MADSESHTGDLDSKLLALDKKLDEAKDERKNLQIQIALISAVITAVLGFAGWFAQSRIQQQINAKSQEREAKLAITQQVYARKLATYESIHLQMTNLITVLGNLENGIDAKKSAADALINLEMATKTDSLYLSDDVANQLQQLVYLGGKLKSLGSSGTTTTIDDVTGQTSTIEVQMKADLGVKELGAIPGSKQ